MTRHPQLFFITGFMGSGKSYWGKKLAGLSAYSFYDTDEYIERQVNMPVSELIPLKGEPYFRKLEKEILNRLIDIIELPGIISLGGGTLLDPHNLQTVMNKGYLIWLRRENGFLLDEKLASERPLYDPEQAEMLYSIRKKSYEKADYIVNLNKHPDDLSLERKLLKVIKM